MDPETNPARIIGAVGIVGFVVPGVATLLLAPTWDIPATGSGAERFAAHVAEHGDAWRAGVVLDAIGVTLWGVFGVGVWMLLRRARGGESFVSACFLFGVVSTVTLLLAGFTSFLVLAYRAPEIAYPYLVYDLPFGLLAMSGLPTAVALAAYARLTFSGEVLPRWTAIIAAVGAATHVLLLASFLVSEGFFSLEGQVITVIPATLFFWILATGVALLRTKPVDPAAGVGRAAPSGG